MAAEDYRTLRAKLQVFETWPHEYTFKFIVHRDQRAELEALFAGHEYTLRPSRTGRYISLTCVRRMPDPDAVIEIYERVSGIDGSFAL
jgi:hypothetical protein